MAGSGQALFDRRCRITIVSPSSAPNNFGGSTSDILTIDAGASNNKAIAGQRVSFKITKTLKKEPNTSEIIITNLNPQHRANIQKKGVKIGFEAGYKETGVKQYFSGDVRTADHVREGADWNSTLRLGDGERAWQFATVYESFSPGTPIASAVQKIAQSMGIGTGNLSSQLSGFQGIFDQGWAAHGSARRMLDQILRANGYTWSIQDGELQILTPDGVLDMPVPVVSQSSGLVGSPQMGTPMKAGAPALLKFKSLLFFTRPGARVQLKSERYNGLVRVVTAVFTGDTEGGEWYTEISGTIAPSS